jgi:hypothetical protein
LPQASINGEYPHRSGTKASTSLASSKLQPPSRHPNFNSNLNFNRESLFEVEVEVEVEKHAAPKSTQRDVRRLLSD